MATGDSSATDTAALVALLYRADWRAMCLTAEISVHADHDELDEDGADEGGADEEHDDCDDSYVRADTRRRVLLAPGGKYRIEDLAGGPDPATSVCDGSTQWLITGGKATRESGSTLPSYVAELLIPAWLLANYTIEFAGPAEAAGRPALRFTCEPRPALPQRHELTQRPFDRVEALADAELGILLRLECFTGGAQAQLSEVQSLEADPASAADPAQFQRPDSTPERPAGDLGSSSGPGWQAVRALASVAVDAVGFAIRRTGRTEPNAGGPAMPAMQAAPSQAAPVSAELVNLLHRTGLPPQRFAASGRAWTDGGRYVRALLQWRANLPGRWSGMLGPDTIWNALVSRPPADTFEELRLATALPGRYRISYLSGQGKPEAVGSDGDEQWALYPNRVVSGPGAEPRGGWGKVMDPAWLLMPHWELSMEGERGTGGNWRVWASRSGERGWAGPEDLALPGPDEISFYDNVAAEIDAELGIVVRLAILIDGQPAAYWELTEVTAGAAGPAGDGGEFRRPDLAGRRLVEGSGPLAHLDLPGALRAAGKAGQAGATLLAGLLGRPPASKPDPASGAGEDGRRDHRTERRETGSAKDIWGDVSDDVSGP